MRARWATLLLCLARCGESPTTVLVHMSAKAGLTVEQLSFQVALGTGARITRTLASSGAAEKLPGSVLVILPDQITSVDVTLTAVDDGGNTVAAEGATQSQPHEQRELSLTLGGSSGG